MPPPVNTKEDRKPSSKLKRLISSSTINRLTSCGGDSGRGGGSIIGCGSWRRRRGGTNLPDVHEPLPKQPRRTSSSSLSRCSSFSSSPNHNINNNTDSNSLFFHHNPIASLPSSSESDSSPSRFDDRSLFFDPNSRYTFKEDEEKMDYNQMMMMMSSTTTTPTTTPASTIDRTTANAFLSNKLLRPNATDHVPTTAQFSTTTTIHDPHCGTSTASPPSSSSYSSSYTNKLAVGCESVAVEKESSDPYDDFRRSMVQMIVEREIYTKDGLQELLACFLRLNSACHHEVIIRAFTDVWYSVVSPAATNSGKVNVLAPTPTPTPDRRSR